MIYFYFANIMLGLMECSISKDLIFMMSGIRSKPAEKKLPTVHESVG